MEISVPHYLQTPAGRLVFNEKQVTTVSLAPLDTLAPADTVAPGDAGFTITGGYLRLTNTQVGKNVRIQVDDVAQRDGFTLSDAFKGGAYVTLEGEVIAQDSMTERGALIDQLTSYCDTLLRSDGTHVWKPSGALANTVVNPSFEAGTQFWTPTGATVAQSTAQAFDGGASALLSATTATDTGAYLRMTQDANAAAIPQGVASVTISAYARRGTGSANGDIRVDFLDSSFAGVGGFTGSTATLSSSAWTRMTVTVTPPPSTAQYAMVSLRMRGQASGNTVYFDAVQVETNPTASAYVSVPPRQRTVRVFALPDPAGQSTIKAFQVVLVSSDPNSYSTVERQSPDLAVQGVTVSTFTLASNEGNVDTYPRIRVYGQVSDGTPDLQIVNNVTNDVFRFGNGASIPNGDYWEIDCRNETVIDNHGVSKISYVDNAITTFFPLAPGANNLSLQGASPSGGAKGQVFWRDAWAD